MSQAIENLLTEDRSFPPSSEFTSQANAQPGIHDEAAARPGLRTVYVRWGEWVTVVAIIGAAVVLARSRPRPVPAA